jgi:putative membrane protein
MRSPIAQLLMRWLVLALGVILATNLVDGIKYESNGALVSVVLLLSVFNAILKPLLVLFTLPFIIVTMGFGVVVINALLLLLVSRLVTGFHVMGFWPAVWGSLIISVTNWLASAYIRSARQGEQKPPPPPKPPKGGDVIDI